MELLILPLLTYWSMIRLNKINFDLSRPLIRLHFIKIVDTMISWTGFCCEISFDLIVPDTIKLVNYCDRPAEIPNPLLL